MKEEYSAPLLEILGDLREVTSASGSGWNLDIWGGISWGDFDDVGSS